MWAVLFQSSLSHSTRHVSICSKSATVSVHKNYIHHLTLVFCVEGRCPGPRPSQPSPASHRCWLKQVDCFNPAHLPCLLKDQTGAISLLPILGKLVPYKEDADFFPSIFISLPWQIFLTKNTQMSICCWTGAHPEQQEQNVVIPANCTFSSFTLLEAAKGKPSSVSVVLEAQAHN